MTRTKLTLSESSAIDRAISHYEEHQHLFDGFAGSLLESLRSDVTLAPFIHFSKYRLKSTQRLRAKLIRKALDRPRGSPPQITAENLFTEVTDLAGVRILHLHTDQIGDIHDAIVPILTEQSLEIVEGPIANCWDTEYADLYRKAGIETTERTSMYSSVHYIVQANSHTRVAMELQVRTLMEEVWGEVSHRVGYEDPTMDEIVRDQLRVLARLTSGSTRLVDCIFSSYGKHVARQVVEET